MTTEFNRPMKIRFDKGNSEFVISEMGYVSGRGDTLEAALYQAANPDEEATLNLDRDYWNDFDEEVTQ